MRTVFGDIPMKKRCNFFLALLIGLLYAFCAFGFTACGGKSASETEGLDYRLSADGTYYICSGRGIATDTDIVIPKTYEGLPVQEIGEAAFYGCKNFTSVKIPSSVTTIRERAFVSCTGLKSITVPDSVTTIEYGAFNGCSNVKSVKISKNVTTIENSVFSFCESLTSVTIPDGVTAIEKKAFQCCYALERITIPNGVLSFGEKAFDQCKSLMALVIPESVTSIGTAAFTDCYAFSNARFENPNGWTAVTVTYDVTTEVRKEVALSPSELADAPTAARYLSYRYTSGPWTRVDE